MQEQEMGGGGKSMARPRKNATPQFIAALDYHMKLRGWRVDDLAEKIGLSRAGLYNKISNPEMFHYSELLMISKLFKVSVTFTPDGVTMGGVDCQ